MLFQTMTSIRYILKNQDRPITKIYMRISVTKKIQAIFPLEIPINPKHWDVESMRLKPKVKSAAQINKTLDTLYQIIEDKITLNYTDKELFTSDYFKSIYNDFIGNDSTKRKINILEFIEEYVNGLNSKKNTIKTYKVVYKKICEYLVDVKSKKKMFYADINDRWIIDFTNYLQDHDNQKLSSPTINKYLTNLKVILKKYSEENSNFKTPKIRTLKVNSKKIVPYFSVEDLSVLEKMEIVNEELDVVRDWILIACETGLRISDYNTLNNFDIANQSVLTLSQIKTNSPSIVLATDRLKRIYSKRNGYPPKIHDDEFNKLMKTVCKMADFSEVLSGSKMTEDGLKLNGKIKYRKIQGYYKKYELVTSHTCRRSFATNKYIENSSDIGKIMALTGHKTTDEFFKYIQLDYVNNSVK